VPFKAGLTVSHTIIELELELSLLTNSQGPYRANTRNIYKQNNTNNNTHS